MPSRIAIAIVSAMATALVLAPGAGATQRAYFVNYFTDAGPDFGFREDSASGAPGPLGTFTETDGTEFEGLAIAPDGDTLFANTFGFPEPSRIYSLAIGTSGALSSINDQAESSDHGYGIVTTPDGRYLYGATRSGGVVAYSVASNGAITPLPEQGIEPTHAIALAMDPDGRHLYATTDDNTVVSYPIGSDGYLGSATAHPLSAEAFGLSLSPDGDDLYVSANDPAFELLKFKVGAAGALTPQGAGVPIGGDVFGSTITPDGRFLYTANYNAGTVTGFRLGSGAPTRLPGTPVSFPGFVSPTAVATNAAGTRLYVPDGDLEAAHVLAIAADGSLAPLAGSPFDTGVGGDFQSVALTPAQPPRAAFTTSINGKRVTFDGSDSSDPDGTVARYDWIFGHGAKLSDGGSHPTHKYKHGSKPAVTLTVTDDEGCSVRYLAAGQTPFCNGKPTARVRTVPFQAKLPKDDSQKLGDVVKVKVRCPADCKVKVSGNLKLSGGDAKAGKLKGDKARVDAGRSKKLKLKLSKKARSDAKQAKKAIARIKVKATDDAGDQDKQKLNVKLK